MTSQHNWYTQSMSEDRVEFRAHYDLAVAYHDKGLDSDAIAELRIALELRPGDVDAEALLAKLTREKP
jgi:hypothetical protein